MTIRPAHLMSDDSFADSTVASESKPESRWGCFVGLPCYLCTGEWMLSLYLDSGWVILVWIVPVKNLVLWNLFITLILMKIWYCSVWLQKRKDASSSHMVWDLDSTLPFPSHLASYVAETIRPSFKLFSEFQRYINDPECSVKFVIGTYMGWMLI